jgi:folate-binding protein YgfZ
MDRPALLILDWRAALTIDGEDAVPFLQGLTSNDVTRAAPDRALWSAFLTPQGKFLHEFMIMRLGSGLLLDCERERRADLARRLKLYRLRSKVMIGEGDETIVAVYGDGIADALGFALAPGEARAIPGGILYGDPRLAEMGLRGAVGAEGLAWLRDRGLAEGDATSWDRMRIAAGIPDGSRDLAVEKAILLESGFDELGGVDWNKGCYLGQELTARTRYRGLIRKRLLPMVAEGPPPAPDTDVMADGKPVGTVRSVAGDRALVLVRLEAVEGGEPLVAGAARLRPEIPGWVRLPAPAAS